MKTEEFIEILQAHVDKKRVEVRCIGCTEWHPLPNGHLWNTQVYEYRVAPTPKHKINMLGYSNGETLVWYTEQALMSGCWKRVPKEDKEIEVEE